MYVQVIRDDTFYNVRKCASGRQLFFATLLIKPTPVMPQSNVLYLFAKHVVVRFFNPVFCDEINLILQ